MSEVEQDRPKNVLIELKFTAARDKGEKNCLFPTEHDTKFENDDDQREFYGIAGFAYTGKKELRPIFYNFESFNFQR